MSNRSLLKSTVAAGLVAFSFNPSFAETLQTPGAKIYYEARGSGPMLLMISGGALDAGIYADLARQLSGQYTVVTYDPRGNSRSTLDGQPKDLLMDEQGDDAALLIETLSKDAAFVFGSSGGAQIGLNLAARHPERVRMLVAHEPPSLMLLPDPSKELASDKDIHGTYLREGVGVAMQKFMAASGMNDGPPPAPPTPEAAETFARINGNLDYFFGHGIMPLSEYVPDVATLRTGKPQVIVAVGEKSAGQITYRTGKALAAKLGSKPVMFPGDHMGYAFETAAFAEALRRTLDSK
jgi:pimeloyl-ACP methyl ester carboxylesterase